MNDRVAFALPSESLIRTEPDNWRVQSVQTISYDVRLVDGLFTFGCDELAQTASPQSGGARQVLVIDANVDAIYGAQIRAYYHHHHIEAHILSLQVSEELKDLDATMAIARHLEVAGVLRRTDPIVAIGGGVLLDLVGFAASLYRRGVPYIKVPTNAMAMWDAAVGIKTAVNAMQRRNRLGSYHPPSSALLDRSFLQTVEPRDLSNGMGELLKLAVIKDSYLFQLLERHSAMLLETKFQDLVVSREVIERAVHGMLEELAPNLWERTLERSVDFGHTFGPLVEMQSLPDLLHGEAVALDVLFSCKLAQHRGLMSGNDVARVIQVMRDMQLPLQHPLFRDADVLQAALADTTRHRDGLQRLPLPNGMGACVFVNDVTRCEIEHIASTMTDV